AGRARRRRAGAEERAADQGAAAGEGGEVAMPSLPILDSSGECRGTLELADALFGGTVNVPMVHQAMVRELADRRVGTHSTRGRSEVSGGGREPGRQYGTGRVRQGARHAPR